ncbi:MAG: ferritin family protein [bacterium]|nr:MAG: ferritin family protein [bacterium]
MANQTYNLKEIIEMAIQIETSGAAFYKRVKEIARNEEAEELFGYLEAAEYQHMKDFQDVLDSALEKHGNVEYSVSEQELLYLRAFASRRIFQDPEDAVAKAEALSDAVEAIDMALDFELRSVSFYQDLARIIEDPEDRASVEDLERQERGHAARLYQIREKMTTD